MKRTWTVRFERRNNIACFVRTHFFKNGISGADEREGAQPIADASAAEKNTLLCPKGMRAHAPELAPTVEIRHNTAMRLQILCMKDIT
jgi:hypothetical protein